MIKMTSYLCFHGICLFTIATTVIICNEIINHIILHQIAVAMATLHTDQPYAYTL